MHLTIAILLLATLGLIFAVLRRAAIVDRDAPTDPNWYDVRHFKEAAAIIDDEDMRTLLDESLERGAVDAGLMVRGWALVGYLNDAPNSLHHPTARSTSNELSQALEALLDRLEGHADTESLHAAVARTDAAYLAYRSHFYNLTGE